MQTAPIGEQACRDLTWVLQSPSLVADLGAGDVVSLDLLEQFYSAGTPTFPQLEPNDLREFLAHRQRSHYVGHYFEDLVLYFLERICGAEVLEQGRQIEDETGTIGELDFVFRTRDGLLEHWETAVKFYLQTGPDDQPRCEYLGPNPADSFEGKTDRMFQRQLPMSRQDYPTASRRAFVRGRVFYAVEAPTTCPAPERLAEDHLRGLWLRQAQSDWFDSQPDSQLYVALRKPYWLADVAIDLSASRSNLLALLDRNTVQTWLQHSFRKSRLPVYLAALNPQEVQGRPMLQETERIFVVPNHWPAT